MSNWLAEKLQELFDRPGGPTVQKVAQETGIPRSYISLIKTGHQIPSEDVVRKLARYFGEDDEDWAFKTKGLPVMENLKKKYPTAMPKYARKMTDDQPRIPPYQLDVASYAAAQAPDATRKGPWQDFMPLPRIQRYAADALELFQRHLGGQLQFPLDAEALTRNVFNLDVHYDDGSIMDEMGPNLLGCLFADGMPSPATGSDRVIMVNDAERFQNVTTAFTVVHELGHYLLHFPKDAVAAGTEVYCRSSDVQPEGRRKVDSREWQASRFAAEVLMPADRVRWLLDGKEPGNGEVINLDIHGARFREFFGMGQAAMEKRLHDLGYRLAHGYHQYANVTDVGLKVRRRART